MKTEMLTDESINLAQNHLYEAFSSISGLEDTATGATQTFNVVSGNFIQILHDGNLHWVCTSNISFDSPTDVSDINVYDSYNHVKVKGLFRIMSGSGENFLTFVSQWITLSVLVVSRVHCFIQTSKA